MKRNITNDVNLDYWKKRWLSGDIGWHQNEVHPLLVKYYDAYSLRNENHFFFPLCGKTLDVDWILQKGHQVTCVEISEIAIEEIAKRLHIHWQMRTENNFTVYQHDKLTIYKGDYFDCVNLDIPPIDVVFDRGAFVAIDPKKREKYANIYKKLHPKKMFLVLYRYDLNASTSPPFAFEEGEIEKLLTSDFDIDKLEENEMLSQAPNMQNRQIYSFYQEVFYASKKI
ncbi:MAG: hypothetical protein KDD46_03965 [Bdellovibrionales bacterium]|nr:hypothetical protein [Bdellovibrionales bacterium]